jgi:hypothetical protein
MKSFARIAFVVLLAGAASAQTPRQVSLGEVWVADGVRVVPLTIDQVEGVLAVDINIVLDSRQVSVVDFQLTDLLPGFFAFHNVDADTLKFAAASAQAVKAGSGVFAELQLEDTGANPELLFSMVVLNGDEIPVEYALGWVSPVQTVVAEEAALPDGYQLAQNYPNPFNTETTISFTLLESTPVELAVYNTSGQKVRTLVEGERAAGEHRMIWNGRDDKGAPVASGRYVAKMAGAGFAREMGMTLLK